jgi:hypothetical protein
MNTKVFEIKDFKHIFKHKIIKSTQKFFRKVNCLKKETQPRVNMGPFDYLQHFQPLNSITNTSTKFSSWSSRYEMTPHLQQTFPTPTTNAWKHMGRSCFSHL